MNKKFFSSIAFTSLLLLIGCNSGGSTSKGSGGQFQESGDGVSESIISTNQEFTEEDKASLVFMWEEEKLARDVYKSMFVKYNKKLFSNIASSEQKHMDSVKKMLTQAGSTAKF